MKQFFLSAIILISLSVEASDLLKDMPLRSKIIFGKTDFLTFENGIANFDMIGCYFLSNEAVDNPSTVGRTLDFVRVQEKVDTRLVKQPEKAFEYRFLENGRLSPLSMVCHGEVAISEVRSSLQGKGVLWEAPRDLVQPAYADILEFSVGTIFRVETSVVLGKTSTGASFNFDKRCIFHLPNVQESFVLRKGTIFILDKAPSMFAYSRRLDLRDVVSGAEASLSCALTTFQTELEANATFLSIVPSPVTESVASVPESKPIVPLVPVKLPDDIIDYPVGTLIKVTQSITFASAYKEDPGVFLMETFNSLGGCHMSALGASTPHLLRKGQILRLESQPYPEKSGRYLNYVLDFQDASSSQKFKLSCKGSRGSLTSVSSFEVSVGP